MIQHYKYKQFLVFFYIFCCFFSSNSRYYTITNEKLVGQFSADAHTFTTLWGQGARNESRMIAVHHLDIAISRKIETKRFKAAVEIGVYNLYNRANPYYYYVSTQYDENSKKISTSLYSVSLLPCIPHASIRWYPFGGKIE